METLLQQTSTLKSVTDAPDPLFQPLQLGPHTMRNRIVMAPLTRLRAGKDHVPQPLNVVYYQQRATAGLIISEATPVSPYGHGYPNTPGIHTDAQKEGWKPITEAVHQEGGLMFMQLWHVGRQSNELLQPEGRLPVAPSALATGEEGATPKGMKPHPIPRALDLEEIPGVVEEFRLGAQRAMEAGFDGVEIHGANGYLLEQFLSDGSNQRTDAYGGSLENRARFMLEVTDAVISVWGGDRVGIRLSPANTFGGIQTSNRWETYRYVVEQLNTRQLAYIHMVEPRVTGNVDIEAPSDELASKRFRTLITGTTRLISAGGHTADTGRQSVQNGEADAIAYGRLFISNPDLPYRLANHTPLNAYNRATFYGGREKGYTDYPFYPETRS